MNPHPNATVSFLTGLAAALLVKESNRHLGTSLDQTEATAIVISASTTALVIGSAGAKAIWNTGIKGIVRHVINGPAPAAKGTAKP